MPKYLIIIEQVKREEYVMELEKASIMDAFDEIRKSVAVRNKKCVDGTFYSVKKVEEVKNG